MHMTLVRVRDGFISAQVSESQPEPERRVLGSDTSDEITHIARKPMPYAFSSTLQAFKYFWILFMTHFMTRIYRYCLFRYWCHNVERLKECENNNDRPMMVRIMTIIIYPTWDIIAIIIDQTWGIITIAEYQTWGIITIWVVITMK